MDKITPIISPKFIVVGVPLIGYDWELPFVSGSSYANSMSLNSTITLAYDQQATIYLDAESQTPYFNYIKSYIGSPETHIVWFIDARTINSLVDVILKYNLAGSGIWNLTSSNQQLWSIINSRLNIIKLTV
jgi:spore germination protein